ncbi:MAG: NapC/NirT family cytochrome c [Bacteroidetes bacterium]|nr:NapC/NirT family cytochrome c [Bacteroidota bacterium]
MPRLPKYFYNPVSLIGTAIALVSFGTTVIFFFMDMMGYTQSPYLGILTYMIIPGVMLFGLFLIPVGAWLDRRRRRKYGDVPRRYMIIDLNDSTHRTAVMIFTVGTVLLVVLSAAGMYQTYNYSESVEFCGEVCHVVMEPEYVAYQHSPHARVSCAKCHIGSGADWFVKSKLSGAYQVYSVLFDKYSRPIETPIANLRPARETCEQCHWPNVFTGVKELSKTYYPIDTTESEPWTIVMNLKIGGGQSELGPTTGIHWHMNTANIVRYVSTDHKRQEIPWIESTDISGKTRIFRTIESDFDDSELDNFEIRKMDCIDCHNRPSHIYYPPFRTINDAMALNSIDSTLPNIRALASAAMTKEYSSKSEAHRLIPSFIRREFNTHAPEVLRTRQEDLDRSIREIQSIYSRNFFPEMKVSWRDYPNNVGHMYDMGCFRCHDNKHVADDGTVLTDDCNVCHTIVMQGPTRDLKQNIRGMEFVHPSDIDEAWREVPCAHCHLGI